MIKRNPARFDLTTQVAKDYIATANKSILGSRPEQWRPSLIAELMLITGNVTQAAATVLVLWVDNWVNTDLELIRTSGRSKISFDSYLYAHQPVNDICLVLAACGDYVTPEQRAKWLAHAYQIVWNIHNWTKAFWGDNPEGSAKHSGWGANLPGNNYNFGFLSCTSNFALISGNEWAMKQALGEWEDIRNYWKDVPEGGSLEGTGYGRAVGSLLDTYADWKDSTGYVYPELETYANGNVRYLMHATCPGGGYMAAIGDQSNQASHVYADQDRAHILHSIGVATDPIAKGLGEWHLRNSPIKKISKWYMQGAELLKRTAQPIEPTETSYLAGGAGHFFARSSWDPDAVYVVKTVGPNEENHDHHDQGSMILWANGKPILSPQSMWSNSGLLQSPRHHNGIVFKDSKGWLLQVRNKTRCTMTVTDGMVTSDLAPSLLAKGSAWNQELRIDGNRLTQVDDVTFPSTIQGYRVFNSRIQPVLSGNTITLDGVPITVTGVDWSKVEVTDWKASDPKTHPNGGYQVLLPLKSGTPCITTIQLPKAFPAQNPDEEDPVRIRELEEQVKALNAELVTARDSANALTKTVEDQSREIVELNQEVVSAESTANRLQEQVIDLTGKVAELETQIENQDEITIDLNHEAPGDREVLIYDEDRMRARVKR